MADEDQDATRPNLEPPRLFGRKPRPGSEPEATTEPVVDEPTDALPVSDPTWMFEPPSDDEPEPEPGPEPMPELLPEPPAAVPAIEDVAPPLFADEVDEDGPGLEPAQSRRELRREARSTRPPRTRQPRQAEQARPATPTRVSAPTLPTMAGWVAAAVTGAVIGLLLVGMTAGSLQACEAVRGTSTCGGYGVPILVVIMAALIAIGGVLLRLFHVPDPGSTSFLAVGMVAVIALLFLLDFLLSVWMLLVIPLIAVSMYLLAYWVTTAFVEGEPTEA